MTLRVAILGQVKESKYGEVHTSIDNCWFSLLNQLDCSVFIIPNQYEAAIKTLSNIGPDAVILSGGGEFSLDFEDDPRSKIESYILKTYANKPILGVCRGMQAMHISSGGKLEGVTGHVEKDYEITFKNVQSNQNSYHNQGFYSCTKEYVALSKAGDGVIKAMQHKEHNWLGIMWHPERKNNDNNFNIQLIKQLFLKAKK